MTEMNTLTMTTKQIEEYLMGYLTDQVFNTYNCTSTIGKYMLVLFPKEMRDDITYSEGYTNQWVNIYYKKQNVCSIQISKKVLEKRARRWSSGASYTYVYKSVSVSFNVRATTLQESLEIAKDRLNSAQKVQEEKYTKYVEVYKFLKEKGYVDDIYDVNTFLSAASKAVYDLKQDTRVVEIFKEN